MGWDVACEDAKREVARDMEERGRKTICKIEGDVRSINNLAYRI